MTGAQYAGIHLLHLDLRAALAKLEDLHGDNLPRHVTADFERLRRNLADWIAWLDQVLLEAQR